MCDHREVYTSNYKKKKRSEKQLRMEWNSGEIIWVPFDVPEMVAEKW